MAFVLTADNYTILEKDLADFLDRSEADTVLLIDRGGNTIISAGEPVEGRMDMISALVAGAFAATQELAVILDEGEFTAIYHQGKRTSIFISSVGDEVLLLALFTDNTTVGLVKMYAVNTCRRIASVLTDIMADGNKVAARDLTASFVIEGPIFRERAPDEE